MTHIADVYLMAMRPTSSDLRREHGARAQARQTEFPDITFSALVYQLVAKIYDTVSSRLPRGYASAADPSSHLAISAGR